MLEQQLFVVQWIWGRAAVSARLSDHEHGGLAIRLASCGQRRKTLTDRLHVLEVQTCEVGDDGRLLAIDSAIGFAIGLPVRCSAGLSLDSFDQVTDPFESHLGGVVPPGGPNALDLADGPQKDGIELVQAGLQGSEEC